MTTIAPIRRRTGAGLQTLRSVVAGVVTFLFIAPILWMVTTAFKTGNQAFSTEIQWFFAPTLSNFEAVLSGTGFTYALINSL
ncbi:MAG: uncharacterized protein JWP66_293, partial [Naasia sp.]|nr:uncharacterized protein [Naasia sp.]